MEIEIKLIGQEYWLVTEDGHMVEKASNLARNCFGRQYDQTWIEIWNAGVAIQIGDDGSPFCFLE